MEKKNILYQVSPLRSWDQYVNLVDKYLQQMPRTFLKKKLDF